MVEILFLESTDLIQANTSLIRIRLRKVTVPRNNKNKVSISIITSIAHGACRGELIRMRTSLSFQNPAWSAPV
jgi:hypothetical protein